MSRTPKYPKPKAKYHRGTWEIYWNFAGDRYSLFPGRQDPNDPDIGADLRRVAVVLAMPLPAFPDEWANAPAVLRYMKNRHHMAQPESSLADKTTDELIAAYKANLQRHCAGTWATNSLGMVKALDAFAGGILKTTPVSAGKFLESVLDKGNTPSTRNRTLAACSRFFGWCKENGLPIPNPFAEIKYLKVADAEEIVYCTKPERARIIAAAG